MKRRESRKRPESLQTTVLVCICEGRRGAGRVTWIGIARSNLYGHLLLSVVFFGKAMRSSDQGSARSRSAVIFGKDYL